MLRSNDKEKIGNVVPLNISPSEDDEIFSGGTTIASEASGSVSEIDGSTDRRQRMNQQIERRQLARRIPLVLPLLIILGTTLGSSLLGREYARYLLILYVLLLPLVLSRPLPKPRRVPWLYLYIAVNVLALILHFGNLNSILNAGSLVVSIIAISGAAYYCVRQGGSDIVDQSLEHWLWISLGLSFILSIALTGIGAPSSPDYFPWETLYSEKRLLLINGDNVGHTPSLWVTAFLAVFTVHKMTAKNSNWKLLTVVLGLLVLCLLATKSRLSLIFIFNLLAMWLAYKRILFMRSLIFITSSVLAVAFILLISSPQLATSVNKVAQAAQTTLGDWVRIAPGETVNTTGFIGRDLLNTALMAESLLAPFRGVGDDADILNYGIDAQGRVAYDDTRKVAASESVLRLAVKYGWPYLGVLAAFLVSIPWALRKLPPRAQILRVSLWGMCVETIVFEGGMEIFYGISGLFLFILSLMVFDASYFKYYENPRSKIDGARSGRLR